MTESVLDDLDRKSQAIVLLAVGKSTDAVAAEIGVSGVTVRRWRREDPEFAARVRDTSGELFQEVVQALKHSCGAAGATLVAALQDPQATIRVRAAQILLTVTPGLVVLGDLEARMAALEAGQREGTL